MNTFDIMLERDTANDESAVVAVVFVQSGTTVVKDEPIFEIENSKATEEYVAPASGVLVHELVAGQTVNFGVTIARIMPAGEAAQREQAIQREQATQREQAMKQAAAPAPTPTPIKQPAQPAARPASAPALVAASVATPRQQRDARFSRAASALLTKYDLSPSQFDADFVTASDVIAHIECQNNLLHKLSDSMVPAAILAAAASTPAPTPIAGALLGLPVGQRKRAEIDTLSHGAGQTMLSVLGISLGHLLVRRQPGDFLAGRITDLVLYEASRLMRKYPRLNAFYADGQVFLHESVHAGLAIDDGGRLMVYGLENADQTGLPELADSIADAVGRYVNNELTAHELTRATFTVTDLSAGELDFVLPLLPRGQSAILGITASTSQGYRLFVGFDHRVTEGREVMAFLGELRDRLLSFSSAERTVLSASVCSFCARSATEAVRSSKEKGLLKVVGRDGAEVLCCGSCWNGW